MSSNNKLNQDVSELHPKSWKLELIREIKFFIRDYFKFLFDFKEGFQRKISLNSGFCISFYHSGTKSKKQEASI